MLTLPRNLDRSETGRALAIAGAIIALTCLLLESPNLSPVLRHPATVAYHGGMDGWKNIYTVAYHALHDTSAIRTDAFNYPAGEHIVFADGQPLLSGALRLTAMDSPGTAVAVVQLAPWIAVAVGLGLLTWLLARLGVSNLYAAIAALAICALSPQLARTSGHFGLSYVFVVPALLHLLLSWVQTRQLRYIVACGVFTGAAALLHLYLLALGLALVLPTVAYVAVRDPYRRWPSLGTMAATVVALAIAYYLYAVAAWPTPDRPAVPEGFFDAASSWQHVFLKPYTLPALWAQFGGMLYPASASIEELGYVGVVAALFCVVLVVGTLQELVNRFRTTAPNEARGHLQAAGATSRTSLYFGGVLLAGVLSLLLSFGIPLRYAWFAELAPDIGLLRQFRALGRFNWNFYYVINVMACVALYRFGESRTRGEFWNRYGKRFSLLALGIMLLEGVNNVRAIDTNPFPLPWGERMDRWLAAIGPIDRYQATLPIPYFHIGGETLNAPLGQDDISVSTQLALATGLSNLGVYMSRQGVANTYARLPLDHPWSSVPAVLETLPSEGDILVTVSKEQLQTTIGIRGSDPYATLLAHCDTLIEDGNYVLLRLRGTPESFRRVARAYCEDAARRSARVAPNFAIAPEAVVTLTLPEGQGRGQDWQPVAVWNVDTTSAIDVSWTTELSGATRPFHEFLIEARDPAVDTVTFQAPLRAATYATILQQDGARVKTTVPGTGRPQEFRLSARLSPRSGPTDTLRIRYLSWVPTGVVSEYLLPAGDKLIDGVRYRACTPAP